MKKLLYFFLPLLAFVACTESGVDDNNNPQPAPEAKIPINISTSITRATDSEFEVDDKIGLYVVNQPNALAASGNHVDNVGFTYSGEWTPDKEIYWQDQTTKADFYAYYPYLAAVNTSAHSFSVKTDQSAEEDYWASDFLWGKTAGVTPTAAAVPIKVNHLLSNILVYIKAGEGFAEESLATADISVRINNVKTAASIDLSSGVATAEGKTTTITPWDTGEYCRAMVVPQTVAKGDALITITIDGEDYIFAPGLTLLANKQHKIVLTIDKTAGGINVSIGNWDVVEENFDDSPEIRITAAYSEETLKSYVYDVFQDAIESFTNEDGVYVIRLKEGYTDIPDYAFFTMELTNVIIGNGITSIGEYAFFGCRLLTSITIPDSVTEIGASAFNGCSSLKAFYGKYVSSDNRCLIIDGVLKSFAPAGLTTYTIPDSVTSIGKYAFSSCGSLESIIIGNSVTSIGEYAFYYCELLTSITIPDSVTEIGDSAFRNCSSLKAFYGKYVSSDNRCLIIDGVLKSFAPVGVTTYTIPDSVTSIGAGAFAYCDVLTSVTIPDSVTEIGASAFFSCWSLESIIIGNSVTSIGNFVFEACHSLTSITIPDSVLEIGGEAFSYCNSLTSVYCKPAVPPRVYYLMFRYGASGRKIYVPRGSVDAYKTAYVWSYYADDIVSYDFE